jgi:glycosyltransferase involved in cell wall biosynthesis
MKATRVSVVTVVLNQADDFIKTATSIIEQDYHNLEWIVIDGGSVDGTLKEIIQRTDRITRWISEPDKGPYDAMNKGIRYATGEWTIFMNAGDAFEYPGTVSRVFSENTNGFQAIYGDVIGNYSGRLQRIKAGSTETLWKGMVFCHQSLFVKTCQLRQKGFDCTYQYGADYHFILTLLNHGCEFRQLDFPIAIIDTRGISNRNFARVAREHLTITRKHFRLNGFQSVYHYSFIFWSYLLNAGYFLIPLPIMHFLSILFRKVMFILTGSKSVTISRFKDINSKMIG